MQDGEPFCCLGFDFAYRCLYGLSSTREHKRAVIGLVGNDANEQLTAKREPKRDATFAYQLDETPGLCSQYWGPLSIHNVDEATRRKPLDCATLNLMVPATQGLSIGKHFPRLLME